MFVSELETITHVGEPCTEPYWRRWSAWSAGYLKSSFLTERRYRVLHALQRLQYGSGHGSPPLVIVPSSNTNNLAKLACQYRFGRSQARLGKSKQPTLCAQHGLSLAKSPDAMLACWSRLDVSELVQTYAMDDILPRSPRSTMSDSHLSFGCMDGSRTTHLIMNAIDDSDYVPLPAAAQAPHDIRSWPRSRPLDP